MNEATIKNQIIDKLKVSTKEMYGSESEARTMFYTGEVNAYKHILKILEKEKEEEDGNYLGGGRNERRRQNESRENKFVERMLSSL